MSNFEESVSEMSGYFPIGFPESCIECPSLVMDRMLGSWMEHNDLRNQVMRHNTDNPDRPAITSELLFRIMESSTSQDDINEILSNKEAMQQMSSDAIVEIDRKIGDIEKKILMHTSQCSKERKPGPVEVVLPRKVGGLVMGICSAELRNPKLLLCSCGAPNCMHIKRISGIVVD